MDPLPPLLKWPDGRHPPQIGRPHTECRTRGDEDTRGTHCEEIRYAASKERSPDARDTEERLDLRVRCVREHPSSCAFPETSTTLIERVDIPSEWLPHMIEVRKIPLIEVHIIPVSNVHANVIVHFRTDSTPVGRTGCLDERLLDERVLVDDWSEIVIDSREQHDACLKSLGIRKEFRLRNMALRGQDY